MRFFSPVLVTGASGFVGSHLAESLSLQGVETRLLVRSTSRLPFKPSKKMRLCQGDVTDAASVKKAAQGVKVIYHLAGILRGSDPKVLESVNAEGTRNVCLAARSVKGLKRLLYVSSLSAAGPARAGRPLTESDPCRPAGLYGETKLKGEEIALSFKKEFPVTVIRPAAVYGPRETDIFAYFKMVRQGLVLVPSIRQKVGFIHVADLVYAILKAAASPRTIGKVYFVADGASTSWEELCAQIGRVLGRRYWTFHAPMPIVRMVALAGEAVERLGGKPSMLNLDKIKEAYFPAWTCSIARIRKDIGFRPHYDIRKGVESAVRFYLKEGWLKP